MHLQFLPYWLANSNNNFYILNNFLHISIYFFIHTYIKNIQITLLKLTNQIAQSYHSQTKNWGTLIKRGISSKS